MSKTQYHYSFDSDLLNPHIRYLFVTNMYCRADDGEWCCSRIISRVTREQEL